VENHSIDCRVLKLKGNFGVADGTRTHDDRNHNPDPQTKHNKALRGILWNGFCKLTVDFSGFF
jgi:hypothetical protein